MSELGNAKMLGGIGAILGLVGGFLTFNGIGLIIVLAGIVMMLLAVKKIADVANEHSIYKNYLMYFIFQIIGVVAFIAIVSVMAGAFLLSMGGIEGLQDPTAFSDPSQFMETLGPVIGGCIAGFLVLWVFYLISAIYLKKSYQSIAQHTGVDLFKTTGLVYLIGAGTVIIGVGLLIILIARILEIISFFTLPDELPGKKTPPQTQPMTPE